MEMKSKMPLLIKDLPYALWQITESPENQARFPRKLVETLLRELTNAHYNEGLLKLMTAQLYTHAVARVRDHFYRARVRHSI